MQQFPTMPQTSTCILGRSADATALQIEYKIYFFIILILEHFFERRQEEEFHERGREWGERNFSPQAAFARNVISKSTIYTDFGYDHITHNAPDPFRTLKLSCVSEYGRSTHEHQYHPYRDSFQQIRARGNFKTPVWRLFRRRVPG